MTFIVRELGLVSYEDAWQRMRTFTDTRDANTPDEVWLLEHPQVFTQGQAGLASHILNPGNIPVVQTDRGGQVTYHGPGQLVAYILFDLKRLDMSIRKLVTILEQAVIDVLAQYHINANGDRKAPGVYVNGAKICAIGLRVRQGRTYHGIAFNIDMDLTPYARINPCGFENLIVTQSKDLGGPDTVQEAGKLFIKHLKTLLL